MLSDNFFMNDIPLANLARGQRGQVPLGQVGLHGRGVRLQRVPQQHAAQLQRRLLAQLLRHRRVPLPGAAWTARAGAARPGRPARPRRPPAARAAAARRTAAATAPRAAASPSACAVTWRSVDSEGRCRSARSACTAAASACSACRSSTPHSCSDGSSRSCFAIGVCRYLAQRGQRGQVPLGQVGLHGRGVRLQRVPQQHAAQLQRRLLAQLLRHRRVPLPGAAWTARAGAARPGRPARPRRPPAARAAAARRTAAATAPRAAASPSACAVTWRSVDSEGRCRSARSACTAAASACSACRSSTPHSCSDGSSRSCFAIGVCCYLAQRGQRGQVPLGQVGLHGRGVRLQRVPQQHAAQLQRRLLAQLLRHRRVLLPGAAWTARAGAARPGRPARPRRPPAARAAAARRTAAATAPRAAASPSACAVTWRSVDSEGRCRSARSACTAAASACSACRSSTPHSCSDGSSRSCFAIGVCRYLAQRGQRGQVPLGQVGLHGRGVRLQRVPQQHAAQLQRRLLAQLLRHRRVPLPGAAWTARAGAARPGRPARPRRPPAARAAAARRTAAATAPRAAASPSACAVTWRSVDSEGRCRSARSACTAAASACSACRSSTPHSCSDGSSRSCFAIGVCRYLAQRGQRGQVPLGQVGLHGRGVRLQRVPQQHAAQLQRRLLAQLLRHRRVPLPGAAWTARAGAARPGRPARPRRPPAARAAAARRTAAATAPRAAASPSACAVTWRSVDSEGRCRSARSACTAAASACSACRSSTPHSCSDGSSRSCFAIGVCRYLAQRGQRGQVPLGQVGLHGRGVRLQRVPQQHAAQLQRRLLAQLLRHRRVPLPGAAWTARAGAARPGRPARPRRPPAARAAAARRTAAATAPRAAASPSACAVTWRSVDSEGRCRSARSACTAAASACSACRSSTPHSCSDGSSRSCFAIGVCRYLAQRGQRGQVPLGQVGLHGRGVRLQRVPQQHAAQLQRRLLAQLLRHRRVPLPGAAWTARAGAARPGRPARPRRPPAARAAAARRTAAATAPRAAASPSACAVTWRSVDSEGRCRSARSACTAAASACSACRSSTPHSCSDGSSRSCFAIGVCRYLAQRGQRGQVPLGQVGLHGRGVRLQRVPQQHAAQLQRRLLAQLLRHRRVPLPGAAWTARAGAARPGRPARPRRPPAARAAAARRTAAATAPRAAASPSACAVTWRSVDSEGRCRSARSACTAAASACSACRSSTPHSCSDGSSRSCFAIGVCRYLAQRGQRGQVPLGQVGLHGRGVRLQRVPQQHAAQLQRRLLAQLLRHRRVPLPGAAWTARAGAARPGRPARPRRPPAARAAAARRTAAATAPRAAASPSACAVTWRSVDSEGRCRSARSACTAAASACSACRSSTPHSCSDGSSRSCFAIGVCRYLAQRGQRGQVPLGQVGLHGRGVRLQRVPQQHAAQLQRRLLAQLLRHRRVPTVPALRNS
ncbi:hypothetical protein ACJJTC_003562 [Scirpophaga incertulas]